jgi:hypothetical protein
MVVHLLKHAFMVFEAGYHHPEVDVIKRHREVSPLVFCILSDPMDARMPSPGLSCMVSVLLHLHNLISTLTPLLNELPGTVMDSDGEKELDTHLNLTQIRTVDITVWVLLRELKSPDARARTDVQYGGRFLDRGPGKCAVHHCAPRGVLDVESILFGCVVGQEVCAVLVSVIRPPMLRNGIWVWDRAPRDCVELSIRSLKRHPPFAVWLESVKTRRAAAVMNRCRLRCLVSSDARYTGGVVTDLEELCVVWMHLLVLRGVPGGLVMVL